MAAFSDKRHMAVATAIRDFYSRAISSKPHPLELDDALRLFIRPEDRELVMEVKQKFVASTYARIETVVNAEQGGVKIGITVDGNVEGGFAIPRYAGDQLYCADDDPTLGKLRDWATWYTKTAHEYSLCMAVFNHLHLQCKNPAEVRFLWEPIVPLLAQAGDTKLADKLQPFKAVKDYAYLHPELREACKTTAAAVAKAQLLGPPEAKARPVGVYVSNYPEAPNPWIPGAKLSRM